MDIGKIAVKLLGLERVKKIKSKFSFIFFPKFKKYKNKKKIIYMLTPVHGNMGDQAIVVATKEFLRNEFRDYDLIEVYRKDTYKYIKSIKRILGEEDIIILHGGGNMGNIWIGEEIERRFLINTFKDNKIISMPQTMSFSSDDEGRRESLITKEIYDRHSDLTIIAREKRSYEIMNELFENVKVILNPDIVLYLLNSYIESSEERKYVMTCLRNDKEGILGKKKDELISKINKSYENVVNYDTVVPRKVDNETRDKELKDMLNRFLSSKVVITDRLHGMVFAALTQTPCIVTKSLDHKVYGTYEWIKGLNYIKFVDNLKVEDIDKLIREVSSIENKNSIDMYEKYFKAMRKLML